ncbi:MAG: ATP-binding cassette domain-containing protein, partial [Lachnospiraceae bacterium]
RENTALPTLPVKQKGALLNKKKEEKECMDIGGLLALKAASIEHDAFSLSGGNQQKVVLAKWLMADPRVLILDEPTRGVDVGAKSEIHALMCQFAARGMAVIMISSELPEVMGMSDRILIYHEGEINGEVSREEILSGTVSQTSILGKAFGEQ